MTIALRLLLALALLARHVFGEIGLEREVYPRARLAWSPPPLPGEVVADLAIEESQINALRDLYDSTNASASPNFLNWFRPSDDPLHTHYCNYYGVSCDDELYVTSLDLNETGLSGTIPDSIRNLERLGRFKAWMNNHFGTIPSAFGALGKLEHLILGQNNFVGTIPVELGGASNLRRLLVQSNDLTGTVPTSLCQLSHLRALDVSRNKGIVGTLPTCLDELSNLRYVRVRDAGITGGVSLELCALSSYGCDGIACGAGSYQFPYGRQTNSSTACLACPTNSNIIGQTRCNAENRETYMPSSSPSTVPSATPSSAPSDGPSASPSAAPSSTPSVLPSEFPSGLSSSVPSLEPSPTASGTPTIIPSSAPTSESTDSPSTSPTAPEPAARSSKPSMGPSLELPSLASDPAPPQVSASPSQYPSELPTSEPTPKALSPSTDFVIGGLNQGTVDNDSPENWTWGVIAVIFCIALCLLIGLFIFARRRRRRRQSEQGDSIDCLPDDESDELPSIPAPSPEPVDPFSFSEITAQHSEYAAEEDTVDYRYAPSVPRTGQAPSVDLESQYEMQVTQAGVEFVSSPPPVSLTGAVLSQHESRSPPPQFQSWEEEVREMPSPSSVRRARREQKRVAFQEPLEEKFSNDEKWLLSLQTTSSMETADSQKAAASDQVLPPPRGDQVIKSSHHLLGVRRHKKWLPVENFYTYQE